MLPRIIPDDAVLPRTDYIRVLVPKRLLDVHTAIEESTLLRPEFHLHRRAKLPDRPSLVFPLLVHAPSQCWFMFAGTAWSTDGIPKVGDSEKFESIREPGAKHPREVDTHNCWDYQVRFFREWLDLVDAHVEAEGLWSPVDTVTFPTDEPPGLAANDVPFTKKERERLSDSLDRIETRLVEIAADGAADREQIHQGIAFLRQATQRLGKRDWWHVARSELGRLSVRYVIKKARVEDFLDYAWTLITFAVGSAYKFLEETVRNLTDS